MKRVLALAVVLALSACQQVVEINGHKLDPKASSQQHVEIASQYFQMGNIEQTQIHLQRALELNPDSAAAYSLLGVVLDHEGDLDGARKDYAKAVSLDGSYSTGRNNYGAFLFRQGKYAEAVKQLQVAADDLSYQSRDQAMANLGRAEAAAGNIPLARQALTRALIIHPGMPDATFELAQINFDSGDTVTSYRYYKQYVGLLQNQLVQSSRSLWLGIRLERIYGNKDALGSYELALKHLYPDSPEYKAYAQSVQ
jgi:type IV pilus assembly protein PilF